MKKFKDISLGYQAIRVYALSLIISIVFYYPFNRFYIKIFNPAMSGGDLFLPIPNLVGDMLMGIIFASYFLLPFFVFLLIKKKQWLVWFIGEFIPLSMALVNGKKTLFWATIFSFIGWLIAKIILKINKKNDL